MGCNSIRQTLLFETNFGSMNVLELNPERSDLADGLCDMGGKHFG
jgi:hypothetical protein